MAFKIKDSLRVGTVDAINSSGTIISTIDNTGSVITRVAANQDGVRLLGRGGGTGGYYVTFTPTTLSANQTITVPNNTGTLALTGDINSGTLGAAVATTGASATTVALNFSNSYNANTTNNVTINPVVGPALVNLASTMTGAGTGFLKKNGADTYVLDTNTYLTTQSNDFGIFAIATDSGYSWGAANTNTNQAADSTGDTLTLVSGGAINLYTSTVAGTDAIKIEHADTSTATNLSASGRTYVTGLTFDTYGHVTGYTTGTEVVVDTNTTYTHSAETTTGGALLRLTSSTAVNDDIKFAGGTGITVTRTDADTITIENTATGVTYDISAQTGGKLRLTSSTAVTDDVTFQGAGIATVTTTDANTITITATEADTLQTVTGRGATSSVATISLTANTASTTTGTGTLVVTGGVGIGGAVNIGGNTGVGGNLTVTGDLVVNGTTTTVNSTTVTVDDKNLELGSVASPTNTTADGGGITLKGTTDKTFNWINATGAWTSSEHIEVAAGKTLRVSGATSGTAIITTAAAAGSPTLTLPTTTGTLALTSDINNGTLGAAAATAGSTNTTVALNFSAAYSANTASNVTVNPVVGPALTNLASTMTGAGTGFLRKNGADTYTLDTSTYLTAESDTLQTVTNRGNTTTNDIQINSAKSLILAPATTAKIWRNSPAVSNITSNSTVAIDSWAVATYRSAKYTIQLSQGTKYQVSEVRLIHDGTNVYATEFSVLETNSGSPIPATYSYAIATGTLTISVTITDAATTNVAVIMERTLFAV